jgi:hypothetical protein
MKVGSLVVVKPLPPLKGEEVQYIKWIPVDDEETIYTVRGIRGDGDTSFIGLEEGVVGYAPYGIELFISIVFFKEVQPPEEVAISELLEECFEREAFMI